MILLFVMPWFYGVPAHMPLKCVRKTSFTVEHTHNRSHGGLPSLRSNEIFDLPNLLDKLCCDVAVELDLPPLTSEQQACEIKHGSFTPLIFATTGATGKAAV